MIDALYIAATGMRAEASQIDVISNNMANLNTPAYKRQSVSFETLVQQTASLQSNTLRSKGMGSVADRVITSYEPGNIQPSQSNLDIAISGKGFYEVELPNGTFAYTRNGQFQLDEHGYITTSDGYRLADRIQVPLDASDISIDISGEVTVTYSDSSTDYIGQITLAGFSAEQDLDAITGGLYVSTDKSGNAYYSSPGEDGLGVVRQNAIEKSNVDLVEEMLSLTMAQRAYEGGSQIIRAADEIMKINNSLRV
ncbi:flagellar hook-basal body protein [Microbulbifer sp. ANSA003]|uniref:flagellar hook-basal body protein n=1 Tax=unclassified Microbulbifer TaxID=2619833 RepID=UPI0040392B89